MASNKHRQKNLKVNNNINSNRLMTIVNMCKPLNIKVCKKSFAIINEFNFEDFEETEKILQSLFVSDVAVITFSKKFPLFENTTEFFNLLIKCMPPSLILCLDTNCSVDDKKMVDWINKEILGSNGKVCKAALLDVVSKKMNSQVNSLLKIRPYVICNTFEVVENVVIVKGFVKNGFVGNKVLVNGKLEAKILSCEFPNNGIIHSGEELVVSVDGEERLLETFVQQREKHFMKLEALKEKNVIKNEDEEEDVNIDDDDKVNKDGIIEEENNSVYTGKLISVAKNVCNHTEGDFKEYYSTVSTLEGERFIEEDSLCSNGISYNDLVFVKDKNLLESKLKKIKNPYKDFSEVIIKLEMTEELLEELNESKFYVLFNLWKYESYMTMNNYKFKGDISDKSITINTGVSQFNINKYFKTKSDISNYSLVSVLTDMGTISFLSRILLFTPKARIVENGIILNDCESSYYNFVVSKTHTGYPIRYFKETVIVKYMFCCKDVVKNFINAELIASSKNTGNLVKTVGINGLFKAKFERVIPQGDEIKLKLYKRVFL